MAPSYEAYMKHIDRHGKAIFMCVSRAKMAEGINFANNYARANIVIGVPHQYLFDPSVVLKRAYLDGIAEGVNS